MLPQHHHLVAIHLSLMTRPSLPTGQCDSAYHQVCHLGRYRPSSDYLPSHSYTMRYLLVLCSYRTGVRGYISVSYVCKAHKRAECGCAFAQRENSGHLEMRRCSKSLRMVELAGFGRASCARRMREVLLGNRRSSASRRHCWIRHFLDIKAFFQTLKLAGGFPSVRALSRTT